MLDIDNKLNGFDRDLCRMLEILTGMKCEPKDGGDYYFLTVKYAKHKTPEYIAALWDAIEGRMGKRLLGIEDIAEWECLLVRIAYPENNAESILREGREFTPRMEAGQIYCHSLEEIRARKVERKYLDKLIIFVGNGKMEYNRLDGLGVFVFRNAGKSVYQYAKEGDYVVFVSDGLYKVVDGKEFEKEYERK